MDKWSSVNGSLWQMQDKVDGIICACIVEPMFQTKRRLTKGGVYKKGG